MAMNLDISIVDFSERVVASPLASLLQIESRQLRILRSFGRKLTLVQKEFPGRHPPELRRGKSTEPFLQKLEDAIRSIFFAALRRPGTSRCTCQRQVRRKNTGFFWNSQV